VVVLAHVASQTARSIRRRLVSAAVRELSRRGHGDPRVQATAAPALRPAAAPEPPPDRPREPEADDADLDSLRVELVRELDRLAAADPDCSAAFRRV
jgi:hypothetical protein